MPSPMVGPGATSARRDAAGIVIFPGTHDVRIAAYIRLAPLRRDGPEGRMRDCRDAISPLIPGPFVVAPFIDASRASSYGRLPSSMSMLEAATPGLIDVLALGSLDRLSRDSETLWRILADLEGLAVHVVTADGGRVRVADVVASGCMAEADRARRRRLAGRPRSAIPARVRYVAPPRADGTPHRIPSGPEPASCGA